ncbi:hypothetical protein [Haloarchaeobius baliensis]|uniref:hypothetical protein n=1 Tax=Haloarchaeobius baliensis TaxID=1670458 RepID=UPI003F88110B
MPIRRRAFVGALSLATVGLSGCLGVNSAGTTDLTVSNETSDPVTVDVRVTRRSSDAELVDETITLDGGGSRAYEEVVTGAHAEVRLAVHDGPEDTYEWSDGEDDAVGVHADIEADSITFSAFVR